MINHSDNNKDKNKKEAITELTVTEPVGLLDFLLTSLTNQSRNNVKSLLTHKQILVDKRIVTRHDHPLTKGQTVRVLWTVDREHKPQESLPVLYEDNDIIVINKPAGLLTIATDNKELKTAYRITTDYVRRTNPSARIFIVHRLDRDTSGVVLFAKNEKIKRALQDNWSDCVTQRGYVAIVEGQLKEKSGRIRTWLKETKTLLVYSSSRSGDGQEAITNYQVTDEANGYSMLRIHLETGRKNQIRVHMKELGHPIAGDRKYGAKTDPFKRLGLHAGILELTHPLTKKPLRFEAEIPQRFKNIFNAR